MKTSSYMPHIPFEEEGEGYYIPYSDEIHSTPLIVDDISGFTPTLGDRGNKTLPPSYYVYKAHRKELKEV